MKQLWIYCLPLLFLPNLGFETHTLFGTLTVSDYFIGPYLMLVILRGQPSWIDRFQSTARLNIHHLIPIFIIFFWWAFISTLTISFRYDYTDLNPMYFSLLKLGKLSLYGLAAIFTARALAKVDEQEYQRFLWSLLASGVLVGLTLLVSGNALENILPSLPENEMGQVFKANPTSVMMSLLIAFLTGMVVCRSGSVTWRRFTWIGLVVMILGFLFAEGRGGWLALMISMLYIGSQINIKKTVRLGLAGVLLIGFAYNQYPSFREEVDRTLQPDQEFLDQYNAGVFGVDDGARLTTLENEFPKLLDAPVLGRGFFHRGGLSGLWSTGSHNFFVQMFLETGVPGGLLILIIIRQMWHHASSEEARNNTLSLPVKAAIIAAIVSGLSGEYFYGGMVLFTLLLVYAPVGRLQAEQRETPLPVPNRQKSKPLSESDI